MSGHERERQLRLLGARLRAGADARVPRGRLHRVGSRVLGYGCGLPRFLLRGRTLPSRPLSRCIARSPHRTTSIHRHVLRRVVTRRSL